MSRLKLEIGNWRRIGISATGSACGMISSQFLISSFHFRRSKNACSGIALIGIIVVIVLMGLLGGGVLMLITTSSMESLQTMNWSRAFFAAESGVSAGKAYMGTNITWYTHSTTITGYVGEASFIAIVDTHGKITSVVSNDVAQWTSIWQPTWHAMLVYGTRTNAGTPQYRIWNGSAWSSPSNALNVGTNINWVVVKACPRSNEYVAVTLDTARAVKAQVWRNGIWGNLQTITNVPNAAYRGMDVAYETLSGDAMVVAADGDADPTYYVWNGNAWTGPATLNITRPGAGNVNWVKLASDPVSDEIIVMVQNANQYYTAYVWNGSNAWGNPKRPVARSSGVAYECMAVEYETSGNQAIIISGNGATANTTAGSKWSSWNGTNWSGESTNTMGDHLEQGILVNDPNSDKLLFTYIDHDVDIGKLFWNGTNWTAFTELTTVGNAIADRPVQGQFENIFGHEGHALIPYSDTTAGRSRHATDPSGATWATAVSISTILDSATVQTRRTGDGKILALFFDDVNSRYDFSWHNGTVWSTRQTLENEPSVTATPFKEPFMMAPQFWVLP